jgi:hypothetical protein
MSNYGTEKEQEIMILNDGDILELVKGDDYLFGSDPQNSYWAYPGKQYAKMEGFSSEQLDEGAIEILLRYDGYPEILSRTGKCAIYIWYLVGEEEKSWEKYILYKNPPRRVWRERFGPEFIVDILTSNDNLIRLQYEEGLGSKETEGLDKVSYRVKVNPKKKDLYD